jgi:hypothetical protein
MAFRPWHKQAAVRYFDMRDVCSTALSIRVPLPRKKR